MSYIGNSPGVASQRVTTTFTATAGQTQFTTQSGYVLGYVDVYLNGAKLVNGSDFEAITGTYITLFAGAGVGDVVELVSYVPRGLSDGYTKAEADAKFLDVGGDTATGSIFLGANGLTVGTNQLVASGGKVGVDTASPTETLTVVGNVKAGYEPATGIVIGLTNSIPNNNVNAYLLWGADSIFGGVNGDLIYIPRTSATASHRFYTGTGGLASEKVRINNAGDLGIGTTNPTTQVHAYKASGTVAFTAQVSTTYGYFANDGTYAWIGSSSGATGVKFRVAINAPDNALTIDSSGNTLIGTATNTNSSKLVVNGTISQTVGGTQYQVVDQSDVGTAPNQIPLNQYLGSMAFQDRESINFLGGTGALSGLDIAAVSAQLNVSATDVFVYDTSRDSDGGAWRKRTQHTSWYNEQLNTATRGARRDFPAVAVVVTTSGALTIYDGDSPDLPMWMVFNQGGSWPNNNIIGQTSSGSLTSVTALNGTLSVAVASDAIRLINFISEETRFPWPGAARIYKSSILNRNASSGWYSGSFGTLTGIGSYDIAMTVLPGAPVDPATGLPVPTVAVATVSGITVLNNDNTSTSTTIYQMRRVSYDANNNLYYAHDHISGVVGFRAYRAKSATNPAPDYYYGFIPSEPSLNVSSGGSPGSGDGFYGWAKTPDTLALGYRDIPQYSGLNLVYENTQSRGNGMVAYIKSKFNTGWLPGQIKGAWLSDTAQETVVSVELVTDGGFESAANFTLIQASATVTRSATAVKTGSYGVICTSSGGSNVYSGREITGLIVGKTYTFSVDYNNLNHDTSITLNTGWANSGSTLVGGSLSPSTTWQVLTCSFTATTTSVWLNVFAQGTIYLDNLSLRTGELDRSSNSKGLHVFGTITKTPVAVGADLVGYSNFGSGNYLQQPYNPLLDFGTGDFSVSTWINPNNAGSIGGVHLVFNLGNSALTGTAFGILGGSSGRIDLVIGGVQHSYENIVDPGDVWQHLVVTRRSGVFYVYVNGLLKITNANTVNLTGVVTQLYVGGYWYSGSFTPVNNKFALLRMSATAPTPEQIIKMYNDEKQLFQENAKATLYGTSDAVTALAYDEDTKRLHVGTSSGRSVFQGLRRVENTTTAVTNTISAADGLVAEN